MTILGTSEEVFIDPELFDGNIHKKGSNKKSSNIEKCPHCNLDFQKLNYLKYHGDKCKYLGTNRYEYDYIFSPLLNKNYLVKIDLMSELLTEGFLKGFHPPRKKNVYFYKVCYNCGSETLNSPKWKMNHNSNCKSVPSKTHLNHHQIILEVGTYENQFN